VLLKANDENHIELKLIKFELRLIK